jgi:hypothetical protein
MSKMFLAMRGTTAPIKPPKHPPSDNPLMYYSDGGRAEKVDTFLTTFLKQKNSIWGLIREFFHCLRPQKGGDKKPSKHVYMWEKVKQNIKRFYLSYKNKTMETKII